MTEHAPPDLRPSGALRRWAIDGAIALAVTVAQLGARQASTLWAAHRAPAPGLDTYLLLSVAGMSLIARRRYPVAVLAVCLAATLAAGRLGGGGDIWIALLVAFVNAEVAGKRAAAASSLLVGYVASVWPPWQIGRSGDTSVVAALGLAAWLLILLAIAELVRARAQRAAAMRRSREDQSRRLASEERIRLARDLHDVLAHNISVINVQANTALHLMDRQPDRAREALTAIHAVSRQALTELRTVLGVLRDDAGDDGAPRAPAPGMAGLGGLLSAVRSAGLAVELTMEGDERPLPADADIALYRIVQESLTNATRHSEAGAATVRLRFEQAGVRLEVEDGGPAVGGSGLPGGQRPAVGGIGSPGGQRPAGGGSGLPGGQRPAGSGIAGMAGRVRDLGGIFSAGPTAGGGFLVAAWLPAERRPAVPASEGAR
jgi:signal transduction histidine kinase